VRTSAPRWLFDLTVKGKVAYSSLECDTGVVQVDGLSLDEADSIRRAWSFHSDLVTRAASENAVAAGTWRGPDRGRHPAAGLRGQRVIGYPVDRPRQLHVGLDLRGLPARAPGALTAAGDPRRYAKASMALRLPMSRGFDTFSNIKDIPFIARHATRTRAEVCKLLKIPTDKPIRPGVVRRLRVCPASTRRRCRSSRSTRC
jgi:hypothetical protein